MGIKYKKEIYTLKDFIVKYVLLGRLSLGAENLSFWLKRATNAEALYKELMGYTKSKSFHQAIYNFRHNVKDKVCEECGSKVNFKTFTKGYRRFCSISCGTKFQIKQDDYVCPFVMPEAVEKAEKTCNERYGGHPLKNKAVRTKGVATYLKQTGYDHPLRNPKVIKKLNKTNNIRYGVPWVLMNKDIRQKGIDKCLLVYGVSHYSKTDEFKQRFADTCMLRYGVSHIMYVKSVLDSIKVFNQKTYGVDWYFQTEIFKTSLKKYRFTETTDIFNTNNEDKVLINHAERKSLATIKCKKCDLEYDAYVSTSMNSVANQNNYMCPNCDTKMTAEKEIKDIIVSRGFGTPHLTRSIIPPKELDLYLESKSFAIEYNGLMYHSEGKSQHTKFDTPHSNKYRHLSKTIACEDKGIQLFNIFENEWKDDNKKKIWISMIDNKLGVNTKIYARKTIIKQITHKEASAFFDENHMQGTSRASVCLGLYSNNKLVSCMSFGKPRFNKKYEWELVRFCNKAGTSVVGGASKLLSFFENQFKPTSMISYANRRWSDGGLYVKLGFEYEGSTEPNYFYFANRSMVLESHQKYQKYKLKDKLEVFDANLSEKENLFNNGFRRIFDCGNKTYKKVY